MASPQKGCGSTSGTENDRQQSWTYSGRRVRVFANLEGPDWKLITIRLFQLAYDLLETPDDFFLHVKRLTAGIASIVVFGFRAATVDSYWATVCLGRSSVTWILAHIH
jgi:hypothetical protein